MRHYAKISISISDDPDWRALSRTAQHLYLNLLFSATINNAGVADWRPVRICSKATGWTTEEVIQDGKELEAARFVVIDEATEEILVRSFVRSDGILDGPKTAQGMANAYAHVVSLRIRSAICREVARIRLEQPTSGAWTVKDAVAIADLAASEGAETGVSESMPAAPNVVPDTPSDGASRQHVASIPYQQPSTSEPNNQTTKGGSRRKRKPASAGTRIPPEWQPTLDLISWVKTECPSVDGRSETANFKDWWAAENGSHAIKRDWNAAYRTWMRRAQKDYDIRSPRRDRKPDQRTNAATERLNDSMATIAHLEALERIGDNTQLALGAGQ